MLELTEVNMHTYKTTANTTGYYRIAGLSVIELMIGLAVAAILLTIGVPSLQETIKNNRVSSQTNELLSTLQYARTEAMRRNTPVRLTMVTTSEGWQGEVRICKKKENPSCDFSQSSGIERIRSVNLQGVNLLAAETPVRLGFNGQGMLTTAPVTFSLRAEDCSDERQRRDFSVFLSGQITVEQPEECGV